MEKRAISDLAQLSDDEFFEQVAIGMDLVFENSSAMEADAVTLIGQKRWRGSTVLRAIADEEASKYLILLDTIRCPRRSNEEKNVFARHLTCFNQHLAKGIYAEYCYINPMDFREAKEYVESLRPTLYLDGPEYTLWVFRNRILQKREEQLYVDYVSTDERSQWTTPARWSEILGESAEPLYSAALQLVSAMQALGISSPKALSVVASIWRPIQIRDDFHFSELQEVTKMTLKALDDKGLLHGDRQAMATVINRWLYPLYPIDLRPIEVDRSSLREAQRAESARFYEQF
jgi:AbiV family abortive infection protein